MQQSPIDLLIIVFPLQTSNATVQRCLHPLLVHPLPVHPLEPLANPGLNNLALLLFLGVFKETLVAKVHEMSRLVDLALEAAEGRFDGFALSYLDLDVDVEGGVGGDL